MGRRRLLYLAAWIGCLVFFCAYQQWFSWFALMAVLALPLLSLALSLPAMLTSRIRVSLPDTLPMGTPRKVDITCRGRLPIPPWTAKITVERPVTGEKWKLGPGDPLPTEHCGGLIVKMEKAGICDYLGLFRIPFLKKKQFHVLVRPVPVPMQGVPRLNRYLSQAWRPKRGGGFSENHELRLYRPGDSIQQIHWKLSAKTGDLILRQPMEPDRGRVLLRLDLNGTPDEMDHKLGRLLWLGGHLLELGIHFEVHCLSGAGFESWPVSAEWQLLEVLDTLLARPRAESGSILERMEQASWQYDIGGGTDEA